MPLGTVTFTDDANAYARTTAAMLRDDLIAVLERDRGKAFADDADRNLRACTGLSAAEIRDLAAAIESLDRVSRGPL